MEMLDQLLVRVQNFEYGEEAKLGDWEQIAYVTETGGGTATLATSTFTPRNFYFVKFWCVNGGVVEPRVRVGTTTIDTGSNYCTRSSSNGGSGSNALSTDDMVTTISGLDCPQEIVMWISNPTDLSKWACHYSCARGTAGASNTPERRWGVSKWSNTTSQIDIIALIDNSSLSVIANGSQVIVFGAD